MFIHNPVSKSSAPQFSTLSRDQRGLSTVEYVIILVLMASAVVVSWQMFGGMIKGKLDDSNTTIRDMNGDGNASIGSNASDPGQRSTDQNSSAPRGAPAQPSDPTSAAPVRARAAGKMDD